ncbi:MAG: hypothetical protein AAB930_04560 [Patescibacteria group bacterium]
MGRVTEHFGNEKCTVEIEFTIDQVKIMNERAKARGLKDHKELISKAVDYYLDSTIYFQELRDEYRESP